MPFKNEQFIHHALIYSAGPKELLVMVVSEFNACLTYLFICCAINRNGTTKKLKKKWTILNKDGSHLINPFLFLSLTLLRG
jgi:hypothetical protein